VNYGIKIGKYLLACMTPSPFLLLWTSPTCVCSLDCLYSTNFLTSVCQTGALSEGSGMTLGEQQKRQPEALTIGAENRPTGCCGSFAVVCAFVRSLLIKVTTMPRDYQNGAYLESGTRSETTRPADVFCSYPQFIHEYASILP